jgi:hypothetical protein
MFSFFSFSWRSDTKVMSYDDVQKVHTCGKIERRPRQNGRMGKRPIKSSACMCAFVYKCVFLGVCTHVCLCCVSSSLCLSVCMCVHVCLSELCACLRACNFASQQSRDIMYLRAFMCTPRKGKAKQPEW